MGERGKTLHRENARAKNKRPFQNWQGGGQSPFMVLLSIYVSICPSICLSVRSDLRASAREIPRTRPTDQTIRFAYTPVYIPADDTASTPVYTPVHAPVYIPVHTLYAPPLFKIIFQDFGKVILQNNLKKTTNIIFKILAKIFLNRIIDFTT